MGIQKDAFGEYKDPDTGALNTVWRFTLASASGVTVQVITYGAAISKFTAPNKHGQHSDIILGFDDMSGYTSSDYVGSTMGRCTNRIKHGKCTIDGELHQLVKNDAGNHLHGGTRGWDKHLWEGSVLGDSVVFSRLSPDGEEGYPADGRLRVDYEAMTTKPTIINMTNHAFFNLGGHNSGRDELLKHTIQLNADCYLCVDENRLPTGELCPSEGTAFDLQLPKSLSAVLPHLQEGGLDHCYALTNKQRGVLQLAAVLAHPDSGRVLEVSSTEPGIQVYTGNFLPKSSGEMVGYSGASYMYQGAICCESHNFPDSINQESFPSCVLLPGQLYKHSLVYHVYVQE